MTYAEYLIESAQSEHTLFEELLASDYKELALIKEGADAFQITLLNESTIDTIKEALRKLVQKIKDIIDSIITKFKTIQTQIKIKKLNKDITSDTIKVTKDTRIYGGLTFAWDMNSIDLLDGSGSVDEYKSILFDAITIFASSIKDEKHLKDRLDWYSKMCIKDDDESYDFSFGELRDEIDRLEKIIFVKNINDIKEIKSIADRCRDEAEKELNTAKNEDRKTFASRAHNYITALNSVFNSLFTAINAHQRWIISIYKSYVSAYDKHIENVCAKAKDDKEESSILYNIKSRSLNESDVDDDEDDGDYDEVDDEDIYYMADEFGDDDDIYYDAEDDEDEVDDYDLDDLEEGCCGKKSAKKECGDVPSTVEPIVGSDESCCDEKEACCKKENEVELDSPDIALAPEEECGKACAKKECASIDSEDIAEGPKADTADIKPEVTDNPYGATYDKTDSYSNDETKANDDGFDGAIDTTLEDPFDSKETDLFSNVNFSELFW